MKRKILALSVGFLITQPFLFSQQPDTITEKEVSRFIHYLASDSMKGRGNGRPELLKACKFIGNEFKKNNLQPLPGFPNYYLPFRPFGGSKNARPDELIWNGQTIPGDQFTYVHHIPGNYNDKTLADFTVKKLESFFTEDVLKQLTPDTLALLLWTDKKQTDGTNFFPEKIGMPAAGLQRDILLVYAETAPESLLLKGSSPYYSMVEYNVVGLLPGKTRPNEVILFSAHYDHEGLYPGRKDSIMNGANDNASGTTAILMLAQYFAKRNDNERTIMFCAFAGEEMGLLGSNDFVKNINADKIVAVVNIEMIGVPQLGKNRMFITGEKYSDLSAIMRKNLKKSRLRLDPDPDETKELFIRSDNYPFALKGVPAHSIMASNDNDACYHQPCDEIDRIDIKNMTRLIKAIAVSAKTLINGEATPKRINPAWFK